MRRGADEGVVAPGEHEEGSNQTTTSQPMSARSEFQGGSPRTCELCSHAVAAEYTSRIGTSAC